MAEREFKVQVLETAAQWKSGLSSRLDVNADGLSLFLNPVFDSWLISEGAGFSGGDIVVDECGQTYWTAVDPSNAQGWALFRHNPITDLVERVISLTGCGKIEPHELWLTPANLWIFDHAKPDGMDQPTSKGRMLGLARDLWQIVEEFEIGEVIDVDFEDRGYFYSIEKRNDHHTRICRYATQASGLEENQCFTLTTSDSQVAIAANGKGILYLLDSKKGRLIRFNPQTKEETVFATPKEDLLKDFTPAAMQIDQRGVIFLASNEPAHLHMFDADGSYLDEVQLPSKVKRIDGIGFNRSGGLLLATDQGLAKFTLTKTTIGQEGLYYSRTLDNGQPESFWHRIALQGRIPSKSSLEVYYFTSDNETLKDVYDKAFIGAGSTQEKTLKLEAILGTSWKRPETFKGRERSKTQPAAPGTAPTELVENPDLILDPNKGRYLWLKLKLTTFDQESRPSIRSARIYYPRLSYLRYLPPAYSEDPVSAAFLERFLSLFETSFASLEQEIDQLFKYFDPRLAPKNFLPWLASWINLSLDDDVPEARVRKFIQRAVYLYSRKGTPQAMTEFLEIYTGKTVHLTEFLHGLKPMVLGETGSVLGSGLVLLGSGPRGMRIGDTTVVGYSAVRDRVSDLDEPFLPLARRFAILIEMDRAEFEKRLPTLKRIIAEQSPAHTSCSIRITANSGSVGDAVLGVGAAVRENQPYRVGLTQLGDGMALAKGPQVLRLERGAWVGSSGRV